MRITKVFYDPPGPDTRTNAHLNLEYVVITNTSGKSQSLTGWTLTDKQKHVYRFPAFTLAARKSVTVRTGKGQRQRRPGTTTPTTTSGTTPVTPRH